MRATRACRKASCWKKLRWRQDFLTVSCTGQSALPQSGQAKRPPILKSISMSSRFLLASNLASATIHGGTKPRASWNRSISRMALSFYPVRRHRAAVLAADQGQGPHGPRQVRVLDCRSTRRRTASAAGARGCSAGAEPEDEKEEE